MFWTCPKPAARAARSRMNPKIPVFAVVLLRMLHSACLGDIQVVSERNEGETASAAFKFKNVPLPSKLDAAEKATFTLVDGQRDINGGDLMRLHDGRLPREEDQPSENFFFRPGTAGGRIQVDLGGKIAIKQINTYSWHPDVRAPQVYRLYGADGSAPEFKAEPKRDTNPESCGWRFVANVDTRLKDRAGGGQHGVSVLAPNGNIGTYRFLLFDISRTEGDDPFGNTFWSEIDVMDTDSTAVPVTTEEVKRITRSFSADGGKHYFTLDTTVAPDLTEWADQKLRPVVQEWYPRLVIMLPSEGFTARTNVTIRFRDDMGGTPASAGGGFVNCNAGWFRRELTREAIGSVVHELVHVVQSYGGGRRNDPNGTRMPGWLVEGIPDYIRWFLFEPQTKGAEITARNLARAKYDASYRITANFLNWVTTKHDSNIVQKLNGAGRAGKYREELWKEATGKTVQELGEEWKRLHEQRLAALEGKDPTPAEEKKAPPP